MSPSSSSLRLWSEEAVSHAEICARLAERPDLECGLAIRLLEGPGGAESAANLLISRLAARVQNTQQILKVLEPLLIRRAGDTPLLAQLLELNALAVEGWVRLTRAARAELN
jgi:hypothetical protein